MTCGQESSLNTQFQKRNTSIFIFSICAETVTFMILWWLFNILWNRILFLEKRCCQKLGQCLRKLAKNLICRENHQLCQCQCDTTNFYTMHTEMDLETFEVFAEHSGLIRGYFVLENFTRPIILGYISTLLNSRIELNFVFVKSSFVFFIKPIKFCFSLLLENFRSQQAKGLFTNHPVYIQVNRPFFFKTKILKNMLTGITKRAKIIRIKLILSEFERFSPDQQISFLFNFRLSLD